MPPRYGKLAVSDWGKAAPLIGGYRTEPWELKGGRLLELRYEIDDAPADILLPPALHPAMPAYASFAVMNFTESPVGGFSVGEIRIVGRAGGRPAAFVAASFCDNEIASRELSARWGYPVKPAEVRLLALHHDILGRVTANGRLLLELELRNRRSLPSLHLQPLPCMNLARNREDGKLMLVQVDIDASFAQSDGGSERAVRMAPDAFRGSDNVRLISPMGAAFAIADLTFGRIQVICDPEQPAESGTTYLD
jgi:hypothetical protein